MFLEGICPLLTKGGDAMEQETFIIILMILVIGYILNIKNKPPLAKVIGLF